MYHRPLFHLLIPLLLLAACAAPPIAVDKPHASAFRAMAATSLGRLTAAEAARHPGKSGFVVLDSGRHALLDRIALLDQAERAFDAQYYIWDSDRSGRYMAGRVLHAATRGVKIRLLIDDFTVAGRDTALLMLAAHPNVQVRVFNPTATRKGPGKLLDFAGDFDRLNRRMHNKSFLVDGSVAIVGGRNIADQYFDLHAEYNFSDRDLLTVGPIVARVSESFDAYWNSDWSYPISTIAKQMPEREQAQFEQQRLLEETAGPPPFPVEFRQPASELKKLLSTEIRRATWAPALLTFDEPIIPQQKTDTDQPKTAAKTLGWFVHEARREILIESAYLVLGDEQLTSLDEVISRGVQVKALTNSLAANDVVPNHAAYARRRPAMLAHGMELYELRPDAASCAEIIQIENPCQEGRKLSLHAKTMVFDRAILYVGSSNINLRSIYLNFEIALIVFSPELAGQVAGKIERDMQASNSWRVRKGKDGTLEWLGVEEGTPRSWQQEPGTGLWKRFRSGIWSLFPLEKYL